MNPMEKIKIQWNSRTYVMGIINITPDSFSGDGLAGKNDLVGAVVKQAQRFIAEGADILDLGAESSRPGSETVSVDQELDRLIPALKALIKEDLNTLISIDTYKAIVAEQALKVGADWINDIWGLRADKKMADVIACNRMSVIIMHNGREISDLKNNVTYETHQESPTHRNIIQTVKEGLAESLQIADQAGIGHGKIILDPGLGFGKTREQNLELINHLDEIKSLGFPILIGPSRKSFIGTTLDLPTEQRLEGTAAAVAIGIARGVNIVRVHDVQAMVRVARMSDAILLR
jgi:dihydropteroate synthase